MKANELSLFIRERYGFLIEYYELNKYVVLFSKDKKFGLQIDFTENDECIGSIQFWEITKYRRFGSCANYLYEINPANEMDNDKLITEFKLAMKGYFGLSINDSANFEQFYDLEIELCQ